MDSEIYLTEEEHNLFAQEDERNTFESETKKYQRGYQNVVNDLQRKLNMRNRDVIVNKGRIPTNQPSSSQQNKEKEKITLYIKFQKTKRRYQKKIKNKYQYKMIEQSSPLVCKMKYQK